MIGGDVVSTLQIQMIEFNPYTAMEIAWTHNGITHRVAAQRMANVGMIPPLSEEQLSVLDAEWLEWGPSDSIIFSLLGDSFQLAPFDAEASTIPVDHVHLIEELMEISANVFQVEALSEIRPAEDEVTEIWDAAEESEGYELQFTYNDKLYRFTARYMGDWYDVDAVLDALNLALEEAGHSERFYILFPGDQFITVIFAPENTLLQVAEQLYIPIARNSQDAINRAMVYQQYLSQIMEDDISETEQD
ncbi:hypothetical protein ACQ4M4_06960 [Leptolyngbya sp. AN02str]|uniref:hypothetical protein n=1 Tax=Leptolyngbya sp. AN02str TaxID=3423363 RepID=UPI003D320C21